MNIEISVAAISWALIIGAAVHRIVGWLITEVALVSLITKNAKAELGRYIEAQSRKDDVLAETLVKLESRLLRIENRTAERGR